MASQGAAGWAEEPRGDGGRGVGGHAGLILNPGSATYYLCPMTLGSIFQSLCFLICGKTTPTSHGYSHNRIRSGKARAQCSAVTATVDMTVQQISSKYLLWFKAPGK